MPVADVLGQFLDDLTGIPGLCEDPFCLCDSELDGVSSGIGVLDDFLGAGFTCPGVTLFEASLLSQARALILTIARQSAGPTVLVTSDPSRSARWLISATAHLPAALMDAPVADLLDENDWARIETAVTELACSDLHLADGSRGQIDAALGRRPDVELVLFDSSWTKGRGADELAELNGLASNHGVAVVAACEPLGDLPAWVERGFAACRGLARPVGLAAHVGPHRRLRAAVHRDTRRRRAHGDREHLNIDVRTVLA